MRDNLRRPVRYSSYSELMFSAFVVASDVIELEPKDYLNFINSKDKDKWYDVMIHEMNSLHVSKA